MSLVRSPEGHRANELPEMVTEETFSAPYVLLSWFSAQLSLGLSRAESSEQRSDGHLLQAGEA